MNDPYAAIRHHLKTLRLKEMDKRLDGLLTKALSEKIPVSKVLEQLFECEAMAFIERSIERRIKESKLPERKLLADFDFDFQTGINKQQIMELATLNFVDKKQGIIIAGSSGTGKSHITKAILLLGCQKRYRCRYTTAADMLKTLMAGIPDNTLDQKLKLYTRPDILLIDEVGFDRLEQESTRNATLFFKVIDARYGRASTLMTTNVDFKDLGDYLGDPVITTAIVDRMVHRSVIINIEGPSWRMHRSKQINQAPK
jgi:DNA replication protein DnaC